MLVTEGEGPPTYALNNSSVAFETLSLFVVKIAGLSKQVYGRSSVLHSKTKYQVSLWTLWKRIGGEEVNFHPFLTSTLVGSEQSALHP